MSRLENSTYSHGLELVLYAFKVVLKHKLLLLSPILSGISVAGAIYYVYKGSTFVYYHFKSETSGWLWSIGFLFLCLFIGYFCFIFITIFFNVLTIFLTNSYLEKNKASFSLGFWETVKRLPAILAWTLIQSTIGFILDLIDKISYNIQHYLPFPSFSSENARWNVATYFALPIICFLNWRNPVTLYKKSVTLIDNVWGRKIVKVLDATVFAPVLAIVIGILFTLMHFFDKKCGDACQWYVIVIPVVLYYSLTTLVNSVLKTIFYKYASSGYIPPDFNEKLFKEAVQKGLDN